MSTVSTVPAVRAKLLALFKAAVSESTEVWPTRPNEDHQLAENVYIGDVRGQRTWRTIPAVGANSREENYSIAVEVEVYREGTDLEGTEARLWEIVNAIEEAIAARPDLERTVDSALAGEFSLTDSVAQDGVLCKYVFGVVVAARI